MPAARFLVTGDLHLGRRPTRLPHGTDEEDHRTARAWQRIADHARNRGVDAIVLTGDIVDEYNKFYEAIGPFERGLRSLEDVAIPVLAVAGNHDHGVLPEIADSLDSDIFTLLGRGGQWERKELEVADGSTVHLDGWSFPAGEYRDNPLDNFDLEPAGGPLLGVLHADLENNFSPYAPIDRADLQASPHDAWLLGHIHEPDFDDRGAAPVLYPGSPQPLDPGEEGLRGPWSVEVSPNGSVQAEHVPLASLLYENIEITLEDVETVSQARTRIAQELRSAVDTEPAGDHLGAFVARLTLEGRTPIHSQIQDEAEALTDGVSVGEPGLTLGVDKVTVRTRPDLDLEALADQPDPRGVLASLLSALEDDSPLKEEQRSLVRQATERMRHVHDFPTYSLLQARDEDDPPEDERAQEVLRAEAVRILDALQQQKEAEL